MPWWRCACAVLLGVAIISCIGFVPAAGADAVRHYEKVSPADKGLGDIVGDGVTNVAARSGDAVSFSSRTPFGDTIGSGVSGHTQYVARRTEGGWVTHAVTPRPRPEAYQTFFVPTRVQLYSEDLRTALIWAYDLPDVSGDLPLRNNIYVEDTDTRALEVVTALQGSLPSPLPNFFTDLQNNAIWGVSADARHVAFVSRAAYLPEAAPGVLNVYQWDEGALSLAGILPDDTVPVTGSDVVPSLYRQAMSADGTRLVFTASAGGNRQLYMRIAGSRTVFISESELDPSSDPSGVRLQAMTPDGHNVFFTTDSPLLEEDDNGGSDLYRYTDSADPSRDDGNLTRISQNGEMGGGEVVGLSDDGQRVYYQTTNLQLVVWDHGATSTISGSVSMGRARERLGVTEWGPGLGRVSPDGRYLAFVTPFSQAGIGPTGEVTNGHYEMYLYSLVERSLRCISCPAGPASADATVTPGATAGPVTYRTPGIRPQFLSSRGQVFFSTAEALVPEDRNGVVDTYEFDADGDGLRLVSTGKGSDPATFVDASASGDDVFLVTRQRLVASDRDDLVDLYDARVGDSLPTPSEEKTPACEGETCQPPPSVSPPEEIGGSLDFDQSGASIGDIEDLSVRKRLVIHGVVGSLRVRLSAAGRLTWSGKGLRAGAVRHSSPGAHVLRLELRGAARRQLRAAGKYVTSLRLTFISSTGDGIRKTVRVTFRSAARKGR